MFCDTRWVGKRQTCTHAKSSSGNKNGPFQYPYVNIKCTPLIESTQESTLSKTLEVGCYSLPGSWIVELLAVFQPPQNIKTLIHADLSKSILDT